jgi:hypothetical protein
LSDNNLCGMEDGNLHSLHESLATLRLGFCIQPREWPS